MTSVHREHGKHGADSGVSSRKQQSVILSVVVSVNIGVLANIRQFILKPVSSETDKVPIISCTSN